MIRTYAFTSLLLHLVLAVFPYAIAAHRFSALYAFGDSLTDTGNAYIATNRTSILEGSLPYGETFFHMPTGRFCDGRLVIDFLAESMGFPLLQPYLSLMQGTSYAVNETKFVNFAVAGATAGSADFLQTTFNVTALTPLSLDVQLQGFRSFLTAQKQNGQAAMPWKELIFFGEIGGNDINYALVKYVGGPMKDGTFNNQTLITATQVMQGILANIAKEIKTTLEILIIQGFKFFVVQGNMPMGCIPVFADLVGLPKDQFGCITTITAISDQHNALIKDVVTQLEKQYPHIDIAFFDFDKAYIDVLESPSTFSIVNTTAPCFDMSSFFTTQAPASKNMTACPLPDTYISWDGVHLTEGMNKALIGLFLEQQKTARNFLSHHQLKI